MQTLVLAQRSRVVLHVLLYLLPEHALERPEHLCLVVLLEHELELSHLLALLGTCHLLFPVDGELDNVRHPLQRLLTQLILTLTALTHVLMGRQILYLI